MTRSTLAGLWVPIATPFHRGLPDPGRLANLGRRLLSHGADGLVLLGTTGEANSIGLAERHDLIDAVAAAGIDPAVLMIGTGACAVADAVDLIAHAAQIRAAGVLLLPPFYFKDIADDGLFAFVAETIERARSLPPLLLYHIPPIARVGWTMPLIARLAEAFPEVIAGVKDSASDETYTLGLIAAFPNLAIFPGS
jgi:4-hydroxy-tetrahydrodipicolinate synthase